MKSRHNTSNNVTVPQNTPQYLISCSSISSHATASQITWQHLTSRHSTWITPQYLK